MKKSTTKMLAGTGIFASLSFIISFLEFPIFPAVPFLQLDFSLVFILICGFSFGALSGVSCCIIKELLRFMIGSGTGGVGEIANAVITIAFIIVPTIIYQYKKKFSWVLIGLIIGTILEVIFALLANRFINFPLFMGESAKEIFYSVWHFVALFNLIKCVAVSLITILLYKRISLLIKKI